MAPIKEARARPVAPPAPPVVKAATPAAPPAPVAAQTPAKPGSGFETRAKRKVSLTGGHRAAAPPVPAKAELNQEVAAQRRVAQAGGGTGSKGLSAAIEGRLAELTKTASAPLKTALADLAKSAHFRSQPAAKQRQMLDTLAQAPMTAAPKPRPAVAVGQPALGDDGKPLPQGNQPFRYKGGKFVELDNDSVKVPSANTGGTPIAIKEKPGATGKTIGLHDARLRPDYADNGIAVAEATPNLADLNIKTIHFKYQDGRTLDVPFDQIAFPGDPVKVPTSFEKVDGQLFPLDAQGKRIYDVQNTPQIVSSAMELVDQATERKQVRMEMAELVAPFAASVAMLGGFAAGMKTIRDRPTLGKQRTPTMSRPSSSATARTGGKRVAPSAPRPATTVSSTKPTVAAKPTVAPKPAAPAKAPAPVEIDVNLASRLLSPNDPKSTPGEHAAAAAYVQANKGGKMTINRHTYKMLLTRYSKDQLNTLTKQYGIKLDRADAPMTKLDAAAKRLEGAFHNTNRAISAEDARVAATAYVNKSKLATGDLQFYKRARDLGIKVDFVGDGKSASKAAAYVPQPVTVPRE